MAHQKAHNCLFCAEIFQADARNAGHQKYCSKAPCRKASQAASRRTWLAKSENQDYFRGPENVARVQAWRAAHPGYWRRPRREIEVEAQVVLALQDVCPSQALEIVEESQEPPKSALQDVWRDQPAVLIGFIAQFTGSALQDDIARNTRRLVKLGHDILAGRMGDDDQTSALSGTDQADTAPVQLGRPPPGARALPRSL
ncbi:MAG: hypothetical protein IPK02_21670 [Candidatus Accumulibacter sp.]|uniref:Uncharacterized protein n=1 Tax=Candidatus Accumulibacter affinis TaxID=2954384 RepID=A0A935W5M6_9PROT|nr:hypothetical protein [Candidatus Accumulibacter affinis]MBK7956337.1 hypothetical protein [Candidatus Accumulibacter affinis]